jgi:probable HAF family extracellular repeat protein
LYIDLRVFLLRNILGWSQLTPSLVAPMLLVCASFALVLEQAKAAGFSYTATQVGTLPAGTTRLVRTANDSGEIVGARGQQGFFLGGERKLQKIANLQKIARLPTSSDNSVAFGINNSGQVVGSVNAATGLRAFRSQRATGKNVVALNMLPGDTSSVAMAINNSGKAVGWSSGSTGVRAVTWSSAGAIQALPMLSGSKSCRALVINDSGDIAGVCDTASGPQAVFWGTDGTVQELDTLPGDYENGVSSINNNGDIVGSSGNPEVQHHAVLWPKGGTSLDLGTLPNKESSQALAINNRGEVVGVSVSEGSGGEHAFLWTKKDGIQDLNDLLTSNSGFVLTHAIAISAQGNIVAIGHDKIITPVGYSHEGSALPLLIFYLRPDGEL